MHWSCMFHIQITVWFKYMLSKHQSLLNLTKKNPKPNSQQWPGTFCQFAINGFCTYTIHDRAETLTFVRPIPHITSKPQQKQTLIIHATRASLFGCHHHQLMELRFSGCNIWIWVPRLCSPSLLLKQTVLADECALNLLECNALGICVESEAKWLENARAIPP